MKQAWIKQQAELVFFCYLLHAALAYSSTLKMEATFFRNVSSSKKI
jgi:hypothetical protein